MILVVLVTLYKYFFMSHADVGHRSAHRPQCRQTSSSFTITRCVGNSVETYRSWVSLFAGTNRRCLSSSSSPFAVKVMHDVGQMSMQASHSMHNDVENTVCTRSEGRRVGKDC